MAADLELLELLAPAVDSVPYEIKQMVLDLAEAYRPACLSDDMADQAQVWYAAWILYGRMQQEEVGVVAGNITSEREGDLARSYAAPRDGSVNDPAGFYAQWKRLADMCGRGAIIASGRRNGHRVM